MKLFVTLAAISTVLTLHAQQANTEWNDPKVGSVGKAAPRSEFISYNIREDAETFDPAKSPFYRDLTDKMETPPAPEGSPRKTYITLTSIPYMWLDRELFIHVEGLPAFYLYVNDKKVGYAQDSKLPAEFNLSSHVKDGVNTIRIEAIADGVGAKLEDALKGSAAPGTTLKKAYLYSQPKLRIEDFTVRTGMDTTARSGLLDISLAVASSYNAPETMTVGYDIYSPQGKLQYYDMRDVRLQGHGRDTIQFKELIHSALPNLWSAESPALHKLMLYVKRDGRMTEYIPLMVGFGETVFLDGKIYRNGKVVDIRPARYNAAATQSGTLADLKTLKGEGINTIVVDYPQPMWFYDLCDQAGLYVIDQAGINSAHQPSNRGVGGSLANDPGYLPSMLDRVQGMWGRNRNHTGTIARSLGGNEGNGYNMYKCYEWLKAADPDTPVIYTGAEGEWNTDFTLPEIRDGKQVLEAAAAKAAAAKTPVRRR